MCHFSCRCVCHPSFLICTYCVLSDMSVCSKQIVRYVCVSLSIRHACDYYQTLFSFVVISPVRTNTLCGTMTFWEFLVYAYYFRCVYGSFKLVKASLLCVLSNECVHATFPCARQYKILELGITLCMPLLWCHLCLRVLRKCAISGRLCHAYVRACHPLVSKHR